MNKLIAFLLSLLVLISSINYSLSAHYCGSQLIDLALFGKAESCSMALESNCELDVMPCCADSSLLIDGEDYLFSKNIKTLVVKKIDVLVAKLSFPIKLIFSSNRPLIQLEIYSPPLIDYEIPILNQSFLL